MNIRMFWMLAPLVFILSGCTSGHAPGNSVMTGGGYPVGILWNHRIYDANWTGISSVGKQIGDVQRYEKHMLTQSENGTITNTNQFPVGTKIYKVPGKDVTQAIGVEEFKGKYIALQAPLVKNSSS